LNQKINANFVYFQWIDLLKKLSENESGDNHF